MAVGAELRSASGLSAGKAVAVAANPDAWQRQQKAVLTGLTAQIRLSLHQFTFFKGSVTVILRAGLLRLLLAVSLSGAAPGRSKRPESS